MYVKKCFSDLNSYLRMWTITSLQIRFVYSSYFKILSYDILQLHTNFVLSNFFTHKKKIVKTLYFNAGDVFFKFPNWQPQKELVRPNWYHSALGATEKRKEIFLVLLSINESKQCQNLSVVLKCLQQCSSTGGWWLAAFRNICSVSGLFKAKHSLFLSPLVPESFRRVKQSNKQKTACGTLALSGSLPGSSQPSSP